MSLYSYLPGLRRRLTDGLPVQWTSLVTSSGLEYFHQLSSPCRPPTTLSSASALATGPSEFAMNSSVSRNIRRVRGTVTVRLGAGMIPRLLARFSGLPSRNIRSGAFEQTIESLPRTGQTAFSRAKLNSSAQLKMNAADAVAPSERWIRRFYNDDSTLAAEMDTIQSLDGWSTGELELVESSRLIGGPLPIHLNVHLLTEASLMSEGSASPTSQPSSDGTYTTIFMRTTAFSITLGKQHQWRCTLPKQLCPVVNGASFVIEPMKPNEKGWRFHVQMDYPSWLSRRYLTPSNSGRAAGILEYYGHLELVDG